MHDSDHEEADSRIMLHLYDALTKGFKCICIVSVDTDVFVILLSIIHRLMGQFDFTDIVFYQMSVKNTVKVGLKEVAQKHGQDMCHAIPFLHALTGSDTTSAFWGIGKKKGYDILKSYTPAVATFGSFF